MITQQQIKAVSDKIAAQFKPEKIVLFGSYAYGKPHEGSDVDLLVVMPYRGHPAHKAVEIVNTIDSDLPIEMLVRSSSEIRRRLAWNDFFLKEILSRGKVLYESTNRRMDRKSGG